MSCVPQARAGLVVAGVFRDLAVRSQQRVDSNVMGFLPTADIL